jgi:hypothetical protein
MKVNQIVSEHKKGRIAKKYTKKPINTIGPAKPVKPMSEDGTTTIKAVAGNDVTLAKDGQEIKTTTDALVPGQQPNTVAMKPSDPNTLKPGMTVTSDTSVTESENDYYDDWINSEYAPQDDESGDDRAVMRKAISYCIDHDVDPTEIEEVATGLVNKFHGGQDDTNPDAHGDIGGDPTDDFINDVVDQDAEKAAGVMEDAELARWLNIAGLK